MAATFGWLATPIRWGAALVPVLPSLGRTIVPPMLGGAVAFGRAIPVKRHAIPGDGVRDSPIGYKS